jgi:hypothetical protein
VAKQDDLTAIARDIIDSNLYMVLGTVGEDARPWVSPVYFAPEAYREFFWISSPEAMHSRNLATSPDISMVVFDSQVAIGTGQGVYMSAVAEELGGPDLDRGMDIYASRVRAHGGRQFTVQDVQGNAVYRMYRATASHHWVLDPDASPDQRTPVVP